MANAPDLANRSTLTEARKKAREWADKALDYNQAGDVDAARYAEGLAAMWLSSMADIEGRMKARVHAPARISRQTIPQVRESIATNNQVLRAWQRS